MEKEELKRLEAGLRERTKPVFELFKGELDELRASLKEGGSLERYLAVLEDPLQESLTAELLEAAVGGATGRPAEAAEAGEKGGLWGFISRWFKK